MTKAAPRKKVLHVYMTEEEYAFLQTCAARLGFSIAKTMLHLADFENRMREYTTTQDLQTVGGINFTQMPDKEGEEY